MRSTLFCKNIKKGQTKRNTTLKGHDIRLIYWINYTKLHVIHQFKRIILMSFIKYFTKTNINIYLCCCVQVSLSPKFCFCQPICLLFLIWNKKKNVQLLTKPNLHFLFWMDILELVNNLTTVHVYWNQCFNIMSM